MKNDNITDIYTYMRLFATDLGERILERYPALHQFSDPVSPRLATLLRTPFPAQSVAIMGIVKRWQIATTALAVAECGAGKTLISLGAMHVSSEGQPYTAVAMVPPHLVQKWAREAFLTIPGIRVFLIDDMRNGGDTHVPHGINEGTCLRTRKPCYPCEWTVPCCCLRSLRGRDPGGVERAQGQSFGLERDAQLVVALSRSSLRLRDSVWHRIRP